MIQYENHLGHVDLSDDYFADLVSSAVVSCFGVAGLADQKPLGILHAFTTKSKYRGIDVQVKGDALTIDLHILVLYGVNIAAITKSIINKVTFQVEHVTSLKVHAVNVYIDGMTGEE